MYCSINLTLSSDSSPNTDFIADIPQFLTSVNSEGTFHSVPMISGYLDTLKVSISPNRVKIHNSSLCKFYLGDNFKTLTKGDTKKAIEKISNSLHLPFELASVSKLEFGRNIILKHSEGLYYPYLGESQHLNRLPTNNGLYYQNSLRSYVLYGKVKEQKLSGEPIPSIYANANVLRIELRLLKRICKEMNLPVFLASQLYEERIYSELVKKWKDEYLAITKTKSKLDTIKPTGSKREFEQMLASMALLDLGSDFAQVKVKEWLKTSKITKKQAYDLRATITDLTKYNVGEGGNELIDELNEKVKDAAVYW